MDTKQILEQVAKDRVEFIQLQFTDILGIVKSLTIPVKHLPDSMEHGTWFDGSSIQGFVRIRESDMFLRPDISTYAVIPWLASPGGNTARFICDVYNPDATPFPGDPRFILRKILAEAREMGYVFNTGPEMEFYLFRRENSKLVPLPHDTAGYFDLSTDLAYNIRRDMTNTLEKFGIEVEATHHEVAQAQHEIDFRYDEALKTADNATTLRFVLKAIAQQHDLHATFMPKPISGVNGSGMHVHQSLFDVKTGENVFFDPDDKYRLSKIAYSFIAGQLARVKGMSAILAPTVNSYKRLIPGYEAPVYICWARINRSALIRIPMHFEGKHEATRLELRCPDPSCNIYLAFAVMLKAGLEGIKQNMRPPDPVEEDLYDFDDAQLAARDIETLPHTLWQALKALKQDELVQEALGEHAYQAYVDAKTREWDDYRIQVTKWELDRYLEIY
jgi:glutamine synthetase